jgi:H+/Cl- antiporter ClcA
MDPFENALNFMSDMDATWWPFGFLRPEQHEKMSNLRVLALAVLYGVFAGMLGNVALKLAHEAHRVHSVLTFPLWTTLGFFMLYRFTFALAWNRRAERQARVPVSFD